MKSQLGVLLRILRTATLVYVGIATIAGTPLPLAEQGVKACEGCLNFDDVEYCISGDNGGAICWTDSNGFCYTGSRLWR
jgi:hypothetical protein